MLATREDYRDNVIRMVPSAQRGLAIMTPDLEPDIYAHPEFLEALKKFVLARSFGRTRVLVTSPDRARRSGNEFLELARRLNSYIEFRNLPEDRRPRQEAFLIADNQGVVFRPRFDSWEGIADDGAPAVAQMYLDTFDELWQLA